MRPTSNSSFVGRSPGFRKSNSSDERKHAPQSRLQSAQMLKIRAALRLLAQTIDRQKCVKLCLACCRSAFRLGFIRGPQHILHTRRTSRPPRRAALAPIVCVSNSLCAHLSKQSSLKCCRIAALQIHHFCTAASRGSIKVCEKRKPLYSCARLSFEMRSQFERKVDSCLVPAIEEKKHNKANQISTKLFRTPIAEKKTAALTKLRVSNSSNRVSLQRQSNLFQNKVHRLSANCCSESRSALSCFVHFFRKNILSFRRSTQRTNQR